MTRQRQALGRAGEQAAAEYLARQGCTILATNYTTRFAEIDIIAQSSDTLCFVEVKTRSSFRKGRAKEAVNRAKQQKIIGAAQQYIKENRISQCRIRLDVVEIHSRNGQFHITHIPNAFRTG